MYANFRSDIQSRLSEQLSSSDLQKVLSCIDSLSKDYRFQLLRYDDDGLKTPLPQIVREYLASRSVEGLSQETIRGYRTVLHVFFSETKLQPDTVTTKDIRNWLYNYQKRKSISNRTLESYRVMLNSFFSWAENEQLLPKNPCKQVHAIRYETPPRQAMTQMELEFVRQSCRTLKESALVQILYSTGCRISELANMKKSDINWQTREVHVCGKGRKHRTCYLNAKAVVAVQKYLDSRTDDNEAVFVTDRAPHLGIGKPGLQKMIRVIVSRGDKLGKHITPHIFRHTTATVALQNGMPVQDVQRMLGHSNISTTMVYAQISQSEVKTMHERCVI